MFDSISLSPNPATTTITTTGKAEGPQVGNGTVLCIGGERNVRVDAYSMTPTVWTIGPTGTTIVQLSGSYSLTQTQLGHNGVDDPALTNCSQFRKFLYDLDPLTIDISSLPPGVYDLVLHGDTSGGRNYDQFLTFTIAETPTPTPTPTPCTALPRLDLTKYQSTFSYPTNNDGFGVMNVAIPCPYRFQL